MTLLVCIQETFGELQARPNSHLPARDAPKDQDKHIQIRSPPPHALICELRTGTNLHKFAPPRGRHPSRGPPRGGGVWIRARWALERREKNPPEKIQKSRRRRPEIADFVPCRGRTRPDYRHSFILFMFFSLSLPLSLPEPQNLKTRATNIQEKTGMESCLLHSSTSRTVLF